MHSLAEDAACRVAYTPVKFPVPFQSPVVAWSSTSTCTRWWHLNSRVVVIALDRVPALSIAEAWFRWFNCSSTLLISLSLSLLKKRERTLPLLLYADLRFLLAPAPLPFLPCTLCISWSASWVAPPWYALSTWKLRRFPTAVHDLTSRPVARWNSLIPDSWFAPLREISAFVI